MSRTSTMQALAETFGDDALAVLGLDPDLRTKSTFPEEALIENTLGILGRMAETHVGGKGPDDLVEDKAVEAKPEVQDEDEGDCGACADGRPEDCERQDEDEEDLDEANPYHSGEDGKFVSPRTATSGSGSYRFSAPNNTRFNRQRVLKGKWKKTDARRGQKKGRVKWDKRSSQPCGREARAKGDFTKCSTGKQGVPGGLNKGFRVEGVEYAFAKPGGEPITELRDLLKK